MNEFKRFISVLNSSQNIIIVDVVVSFLEHFYFMLDFCLFINRHSDVSQNKMNKLDKSNIDFRLNSHLIVTPFYGWVYCLKRMNHVFKLRREFKFPKNDLV